MGDALLLERLLAELDKFGSHVRRLSLNLMRDAGRILIYVKDERGFVNGLAKLDALSAEPTARRLDEAWALLPSLPEGERPAAETRLLVARNAYAWSLAASGRASEARNALCSGTGPFGKGGGAVRDADLAMWMLARAAGLGDFHEVARIYALLPEPFPEPFPEGCGPLGRSGLDGSDCGPASDPGGKSARLELACVKVRAIRLMTHACLSGANEIDPEPFLAEATRLLSCAWRVWRSEAPSAELPTQSCISIWHAYPYEDMAPDDPLAARRRGRGAPPPYKVKAATAVGDLALFEWLAFVDVVTRLRNIGALTRLRNAFEGLCGPPPEEAAPGDPYGPPVASPHWREPSKNDRIRAAEFAGAACSILCGKGGFPDEVEHYLLYLQGTGSLTVTSIRSEVLSDLVRSRARARDFAGATADWDRFALMTGKVRADAMKAPALEALAKAFTEEGELDRAVYYCDILMKLPRGYITTYSVLSTVEGLLARLEEAGGYGAAITRIWKAAWRLEPGDKISRDTQYRCSVRYIRHMASTGNEDEAIDTFKAVGGYYRFADSDRSALWASAALSIVKALTKAGRRPEALQMAFGLKKAAAEYPCLQKSGEEIEACIREARTLQ
ncbi:MAG: hypothetical protein LBQ12_04605 [Deltaproteobacteria bacterium]|jgi:hypothetical protein|nr:hypothetical protein [Deltaproteobacteria bacterium]